MLDNLPHSRLGTQPTSACKYKHARTCTHSIPPPSALSGTSLNIHHSGCSESAVNAASHSRESLKPTLSSALPSSPLFLPLALSSARARFQPQPLTRTNPCANGKHTPRQHLRHRRSHSRMQEPESGPRTLWTNFVQLCPPVRRVEPCCVPGNRMSHCLGFILLVNVARSGPQGLSPFLCMRTLMFACFAPLLEMFSDIFTRGQLDMQMRTWVFA